MKKQPLAIGIENYKEIIEKNYYYIDKSYMIKDLIEEQGKVNLFTRPRRFGKTLALSMIRTFFEKEYDISGNLIDNTCCFTEMKIGQEKELCEKYQGKYPVITLSLKSTKQPTFELAYQMIAEQIASEFKRHRYLLNSDTLLEDEKERYRALMIQKGNQAEMTTALKFLSDCLNLYHKQKVIVLIDEYDVPLENAYFRDFYENMTDFIRSLFESVLKSNDSLEFAVITGCLRVSKESIFTGLNNLEIISILNENYAKYFGFTQEEAEEMLSYYGISEKKEELKRWYDGYLYGNVEVYNPWSVVNYIKTAITNQIAFPKPYWSNTSSNSIVKELIETADSSVRKEIEELIAGKELKKPVHEDITYADIKESQDNLWNFLFFTGYLKMTGQSLEGNTIYLKLAIPNEEVRYIYQNTIQEWFKKSIRSKDLSGMYEALLDGNQEKFEEYIKRNLRESISYYDKKEDFYHGFLLGFLSSLEDYEILSNRESGNGRPDILLKPYDEKMPAIILELKYAERFTQMEEKCKEALSQIDEKGYADGLINEGYEKILKYGICFCQKSCRVLI